MLYLLFIYFSGSLVVEAEILKKKTFLEQQKHLENNLSLAQINGRLSELQEKRDELEEEKEALLRQAKNTNKLLLSFPEMEAKWYFYYQMRFIVH